MNLSAMQASLLFELQGLLQECEAEGVFEEIKGSSEAARTPIINYFCAAIDNALEQYE